MALSRATKWSLFRFGCALALGVAAMDYLWCNVIGEGIHTASDCGESGAQLYKFGFNAEDRAVWYGDAILPLIVSESHNPERPQFRNAPWIADVLGRIHTEKGQK